MTNWAHGGGGTCSLKLPLTLLTGNKDILRWRYEAPNAINMGPNHNNRTKIQNVKNEWLDSGRQ